MHPLLNLEGYLYEVLKIKVDTFKWKKQQTLPFFLTHAFAFYETVLFNQHCLLMIAHETTKITPGIIQKYIEQIQKSWNGSIIYVQASLSSYNRKRLIEHHIPFIIPGNQMYLPQLGMDLRDHFRKTFQNKQTRLSPSTQAIVIYALIHNSNEKVNPSLLGEKLGYTPMTMTRAFNELEALEIGEVHRKGKERFWSFKDKISLWKQAKSHLRDPVKKRIWVKNHSLKILGGLSALSHYSQLSPPPFPIFATSGKNLELLKQLEVEEIPSSDGASAEIEIWHYDPELFAKDGFVDPISLYYSLNENKDERIELCLEEMMEKLEW